MYVEWHQHAGPYKYCSYSEFHHVNWSQGWIHEFLERWWLVVQVALTNKTTGDHLFFRLWTHHGKLVRNRVSANSGLTLINTTNINFQLLHVRLPFEKRGRSCCSIIYYIDWSIYISYRYIYPFDEWFPKIGLCNVLKRKTQLTQLSLIHIWRCRRRLRCRSRWSPYH